MLTSLWNWFLDFMSCTGYGKMKINTSSDFSDFRGLIAMTSLYTTTEPYYEGSYDLRIQKIGDSSYRAFKRVSMSGSWKTNVGSSKLEEIPMTPCYKRWADEAATMLGGLDILTVDAIHSKRDGMSGLLTDVSRTAFRFVDRSAIG